jgi:hypothetical protein
MLLSLLVSLPVLMCPVAMYVTLEPKPKCYGTALELTTRNGKARIQPDSSQSVRDTLWFELRGC